MTQRKRGLAGIAALAVSYYAAARVGLPFSFQHSNATPVWPPAGVALAGLLLLGWRAWPGVLLGAFAANFAVFRANGALGVPANLAVSALIACGNTAEALAGRWLCLRFARRFGRGEDEGWHALLEKLGAMPFAAAALLMALAGAAIGPLTVCAAGAGAWRDYPTVWFTWWAGDATGALLVAPFLLAWTRPKAMRPAASRLAETTAALFLLWLFSWAFFDNGPEQPLAFAAAVPLMWIGLRLGTGAMATGLLLVAGCRVWYTVHGAGPFGLMPPNNALLYLLGYLWVTALVNLSLAAAVDALRDSESSLKLLNSQLERDVLEIGDEERRRIGYDLHDGVCQQLTGIACMTGVLEKRLSTKSPAEAAETAKISELVKETIAQTRDAVKGLTPIDLRSGGLTAALRELALSTRQRTGIDCWFQCDEDARLDDLFSAAHLFRIAQECVNNAVKHSRAKSISVRLTEWDGNLTLVVEDDGAGLPEKPERADGVGLQAMRYRAAVINAALTIEGRAGGGTRVACTLTPAADEAPRAP